MSYQLGWSQTGANAWDYDVVSANPGNGTGTIYAVPTQTPATGQVMEALQITFTNTFAGRMRRDGDLTTEGNMIVTPAGVGGSGARGLEMWQRQSATSARNAANVHNDRQTITFDFGRPVTNLSFTISDVDASGTTNGNTGQYRDAVYVSQAPTSVVLGDRVTGSGTTASPWVPNVATSNNSALDNTTSARGNVRLTYAGPIQSLSVTFYNLETRTLSGNGAQAIYFTNFTFGANSCIAP